MSPYEYVGFLAFGLNVAGNWLLTDKRSSGWGIRIGSNAAQFAYGLLVASPYLVVNAIVFGGINIRGAVQWRRQDARTTMTPPTLDGSDGT